MQNIHVRVDAFTGSYGEIGFKQGTSLKESALISFYKKRLPRSRRTYHATLQEVKSILTTYHKGLWEELIGLAEGLEWTIEDVVTEFSGFQGDWKASGCSAYMANGTYVRNYDYSPKTYEGRFLFTRPKNGTGMFGFCQRLIGRIDGMNEHGLVSGYHFVNRIRPKDGFICTTINRLVLELCSTIEEGVLLLQELPHRHSFNYSLYDARGDGAIVEAAPQRVDVRRNHRLACVNHFSQPAMRQYNRHHLVHSQDREERMTPFIQQNLPVMKAFQLLNDPAYGVFQDDYKNYAGTIHTAAYRPQKLDVLIGIGSTSKPNYLSLASWLSGESNRIKKLRGTIHSAIPFPFS